MGKWVLIDDAGALKEPPVSRSTVFRAAARGEFTTAFRKCRTTEGEIVYRRCVSVASFAKWRPSSVGGRAHAVDAATLKAKTLRRRALAAAKAQAKP